jgi:endonuclease YncB( thermonuclease family)
MQPVTCLILVLVLLALPVMAAERLVGRARVIDGDTIVVGGVHVRLQGVAAPEVAHPGQPQDEPGGPEARAFMQELVEDQTVVCTLTGERTRGRRVGTCMVDGRDIGGELIEAGLARDCPRYSHGCYAALELPDARRLPLPGYCSPR